MMDWLETTWSEVGWSLMSLVIVYGAIIAFTRIAGLRSFSKMSASDFAMTVAVGSLFASAATSPKPALPLAIAVLAGLFLCQWFVAWARRSITMADRLLDNQPVLLMRGPNIIHENMEAANVTQSDLMAKLREANIIHTSEVRAVVFETTGDISVLHAEDADAELESRIMENVAGWPTQGVTEKPTDAR